MTITMTEPRTVIEFSVSPVANVVVSDEGAELDAVQAALLNDERVIGPVVTYDHERQHLGAVFQIEREDPGASIGIAADAARLIFDQALEQAGIDARTAGVSVVEGGDPDQLP